MARLRDGRILIVREAHRLRPEVEACIGEVYDRAFDAYGLTFPRRLVAFVDGSDLPICAAGLRTCCEGFFSEAYLDAPIEGLLTARFGQPVARRQVFEVTTLASRASEISPIFIRQLVRFGKRAGFHWSMFTATARLRALLYRLGIPMAELQPADPARLGDAWRWGRYYAESPVVCVVSRDWLDDRGMTAEKACAHA